jgi:hypothetical protein
MPLSRASSEQWQQLECNQNVDATGVEENVENLQYACNPENEYATWGAVRCVDVLQRLVVRFR